MKPLDTLRKTDTAREGGDLDGRVAMVTGGAGSIGSATVRRLIRGGARVAILDVADERGQALAAEFGSAACYLHCDHADDTQCAAAVTTVLARWGRLDVLFNNAGRGTGGSIDEHDPSVLARDLAMTLVGPWQMTRHALPALRASALERPAHGSVVLFTSSAAGLFGAARNASYSAAKHGIVGLVRSLALELGPQNIRVNAVCPGAVDTPDKTIAQSGWRREAIERARAVTPLGRIPDSADIAQVAYFLSTDAARAISGQAILVDCGMRSH